MAKGKDNPVPQPGTPIPPPFLFVDPYQGLLDQQVQEMKRSERLRLVAQIDPRRLTYDQAIMNEVDVRWAGKNGWEDQEVNTDPHGDTVKIKRGCA